MTIYHRLYSRTAAAVAVIVASWLLVLSQSRVVYDAMGVIHPSWPAYLHAVAAAGYEIATMGCGLVIAVRGGSARLWAGMAVFLAVSSWLGFDAAMRGLVSPAYLWRDVTTADPVTLTRAVLTGAALPFQYLLAVAAGRSLVGDVAADGGAVVTASQPSAARETPAKRMTRAILTGAALPFQSLLAVAAGRSLVGDVKAEDGGAAVTASQPNAGHETPVKRTARTARPNTSTGRRTRETVTPDDVSAWTRMASEGMSAREIAAQTGRSARTVQQHLQRARAA